MSGTTNTALSGMAAAQRALDVHGNNIANTGTVGFKASGVIFADVYASSGGNAAGSGVTSSVIQKFGTSTITPSSNVLDMAINGGGFFIQSNGGAISYTRNGQFKLDDQGGIINANTGFALWGEQALNGRTTGVRGPLSITAQELAPSVSTVLNLGLNLSSTVDSSVPKVAIPFIATADNANPDPDTYTSKTSTTFYDGLGNSHVLDMYYIHADSTLVPPAPVANAGPNNTWYFVARVDGKDLPAAALPPTATGQENSVNLPRITFNGDGTILNTNAAGGVSTGTDQIALTIPNDFLNGAAGDGGSALADMTLTLDFGLTTQFGSPFAVQSLEDTTGNAPGKLQSLSIDEEGKIFGTFSNGKNSLLGSVLLATFRDPENLQNVGQNGWIETNSSGRPLISGGNTGATGAIQSGATEDSATDLTGSLVGLNNASRTFQANARVISVSDEMIQTILQSI